MIRPSIIALVLSVLPTLAAARSDPRSCDIVNPACPNDEFPMVIRVSDAIILAGADPCFEREFCQIIDQPLIPTLVCTVGDNGVQCQAWPRSLPPAIDVSPRTPILYRWIAQGDLSGPTPTWTENPVADFGCSAKEHSIGIVQLEIMSPYGLISSTSAATGCDELVEEPVGPIGVPIRPPEPTPDPRQ